MNTNLPSVPVDDIAIHPRDNSLVIGTHGRSLWILDDIAPLEAMNSEVLTSPLSIAPIPTARLINLYSPQAWFGAGQFFAPNPGYGASINYYVQRASDRGATLAITDAQGKPARTLAGPAARGWNRIYWDLRLDSPSTEETPAGPEVAGFGGPARAP